MAKPASVTVAGMIIVVGLVLGFAGISVMLEAGSFAEGESSSSSGPLGLWGESDSRAGIPTSPVVGLVVALVGASALVFGLRALFVATEGRGEL